MNLDECITTIRSRLDDEVIPYLWPQADLISYINAKRNEFARRTGYFRDSNTSAITLINAFADTADYLLEERVITIDRVRGSWSDTPLRRKSVAYMDEFHAGWQDTDAGTPVYYLIDKTTGYLTVWPKPSTDGSIYLTVTRLPMRQFNVGHIGQANPESLEIPIIWQEDLINGVLAMAYAKPDSQTRNPEKAQQYTMLWERFINDVLIDLTRDRGVDTDAEPLPDYYNIYEG